VVYGEIPDKDVGIGPEIVETMTLKGN